MRWIHFFLLIILCIPAVSATEIIIASSASWQNVYSAGVYAMLNGDDFHFLVSSRHSELLADELDKSNPVTVIESSVVPFARNYADTLNSAGFTAKTLTITETNGNLDLAKKLPTNKYFIVDPTFGYDAISILQYAIYTGSYVLFASKENVAQINEFLITRVVEKITIYGDVDQEVKEALAAYSPEIIHKGNRFKNNIEIVEMFRKATNAQQIYLTNGEFLEADLFRAGLTAQPILFIGKDQPPEEVMQYLQSTPFKTTVVLGPDLFNSANRIKTTLGIPLFIKYAKGIARGSGEFTEVQGLDIFPVPKLDIKLSYQGIFYNTENRQIELVLKNQRAAKTYVKTSIILSKDGQPLITLGDSDTMQMSDFETKGFTYDIDLTEHLTSNITVQLFVPYGASEDTMENVIAQTIPLTVISEKDTCELDIKDAIYDEKTQRFNIKVTSAESCYVRPTIENLIIDDEPASVSGDVELVSGTSTLTIKQRMNSVDIADNQQIKISIRYGKREAILSHALSKELPLTLVAEQFTQWIILSASILALIIAAYFMITKLTRKSKAAEKKAEQTLEEKSESEVAIVSEATSVAKKSKRKSKKRKKSKSKKKSRRKSKAKKKTAKKTSSKNTSPKKKKKSKSKKASKKTKPKKKKTKKAKTSSKKSKKSKKAPESIEPAETNATGIIEQTESVGYNIEQVQPEPSIQPLADDTTSSDSDLERMIDTNDKPEK